MKTLEQTKEWYISAVKATLVLNFNVLEGEAERAIDSYGLKKRIEANPESELSNSIDGVAEDIARKEFVGRPNQLVYKGFYTEVRFDSHLRHLYGRVFGTDEFVSFEANSIGTVENAFHRAVDEYLDHTRNQSESIPEIEAAARLIKDDEPVIRPALPEGSVMVAPAFHPAPVEKQTRAASEPPMKKEELAQFIDSMSDEDFLKSMGIKPEEEAAAAYKEEQISKEESRKAIDEMTDPEFLKSMGIDPDEVVL